jgi:hypothetical protein
MSDQGSADALGFELIPPQDMFAPADRLDAIADAVAADATVAPQTDDAPVPFGVTPVFDYDACRFVRRGSEPAVVEGHAALAEWCSATVRSRRYAHAIYSARYGTQMPKDQGIGSAGPESVEAADDWRTAIIEALMVHDRITNVTLDVTYDPLLGQINVTNLAVTTDEELPLRMPDLRLTTEEL